MEGFEARSADEVPWADVETVFGTRGDAAACWCQRYKVVPWWQLLPREELKDRLRDQTYDPEAAHTTGIVGYLDGEPVGWCGVEPRTSYDRLLGMPIPKRGSTEKDLGDDSVWAVTCFVVRVGYRRRGVSYALAAAAVDHAREHGARVLEAYPMITTGKEITWGELHVGNRNAFAAAGFEQVAHPFPRRVVMRRAFQPPARRGSARSRAGGATPR